jgi:hypothetical protein
MAGVIKGVKNAKIAPEQAQGICLPLSVRQKGNMGFGNGASRVILYDKPNATLPELSQHFRNQLRWCRENGSWYMPNLPLKWIPLFIINLLVRLSTRVKNVDRGSVIVSSYDGTALKHKIPQMVDGVCIGGFTHSYSIFIAPVFFSDYINLCVTYNDGVFSREDINRLLVSISDALMTDANDSSKEFIQAESLSSVAI